MNCYAWTALSPMIKEDDSFITVGDENGYESSVDNDDDISSDDDPDSNKLEAEVNNNMYCIHSLISAHSFLEVIEHFKSFPTMVSD